MNRDFNLAHYCIYSRIVHVNERQTGIGAELMARMLYVMKIIGIVDYLFAVKFIVAHLHIHYEAVFAAAVL